MDKRSASRVATRRRLGPEVARFVEGIEAGAMGGNGDVTKTMAAASSARSDRSGGRRLACLSRQPLAKGPNELWVRDRSPSCCRRAHGRMEEKRAVAEGYLRYGRSFATFRSA